MNRTQSRSVPCVRECVESGPGGAPSSEVTSAIDVTEKKLAPRFRQRFMSCPVDTASRASASRSGRGGTAPARTGPGLRVSRFVRARTWMRQVRAIGVSSAEMFTGILSGPAISRSMSSNDDSFERPVSLEAVLSAPSSARNLCTFEAGRPVHVFNLLARRVASTMPRPCTRHDRVLPNGRESRVGIHDNHVSRMVYRTWCGSISGLGGCARPACSDNLPDATLSRRKPGKGVSRRVRRSRAVTWNAKTVVCGLTDYGGNRNLGMSLLSVSGTSRPSA